MSKSILLFSVVLLVFVLFCANFVYAQYSSDGIGRSIDRLTDWVTKVLGGGAVVGGAIYVGVRMSFGDRDALKNGAMVILGGLIVFLAKDILNLIRSFTGK